MACCSFTDAGRRHTDKAGQQTLSTGGLSVHTYRWTCIVQHKSTLAERPPSRPEGTRSVRRKQILHAFFLIVLGGLLVRKKNAAHWWVAFGHTAKSQTPTSTRTSGLG